MREYITNYLLLGIIVAAIYDLWIDPMLGVRLKTKERVILGAIMTVFWLPIVTYTFTVAVYKAFTERK